LSDNRGGALAPDQTAAKMDAIANWLWDVFLFLVDPRHMGACAVIGFCAFYLVSRQPFRALLLAACLPGLVAFAAFILALELKHRDVLAAHPIIVLFPLFESIGFPSLFFGSIIGIKAIFGFLTNKSDYVPNKIYIFMLVLQSALSVMTVYMTHFNVGVG
jgi:hypothetical protein